MSQDLAFLQTLTERELTELVIIPLLEELDYEDIRYTHGILEHGKDVVCLKSDALGGESYFGLVIKARPLKGDVSRNRSLREALFQAEQALNEPFLSPLDGREVTLKHVYVVSSHEIAPLAVSSIQKQLQQNSRHVTFVDGPRLVTLLNEHLPDLLSSIPDPTHIYLLGLRQRFLQLTTAISLGSRRELLLTDIYTGGGLTPTTPTEAEFLTFVDLQLDSAGLDAMEVFSSTPYLVILADVGAGKTTLLKKLALDLVPLHGSIDRDPKIIPIFIELSTLPRKSVSSKIEFLTWLSRTIKKKIKDRSLETSSIAPYLLLLDGFDEIPAGHEVLSEYINEIPGLFPAGIVVTSRPSRIPRLGDPFRHFRLDPFQNHEIQLFLTKWLQDEDRVSETMEHIKSDETLLRFCRTPLLLTLYAVLASSDSFDRLPSRRSEIYESLAALLLGKWDTIRKVINQFTPGLKSYSLEKLAFSLHEQGQKVFAKKDFLQITVPLLSNSPSDTASSTERGKEILAAHLFDELLFRSSLLRRHEGGHFCFTHLSFQEFFCARYLIRLGDRKRVERLLYADWWKNVCAFYFGITKSMDGVRISSKKAAEKGHTLVEYLAEADYTSAEQRDIIYRLVASQLLSTTEWPASVIDACRRLGRELLTAVERLLDESWQRIWVGFFDFCLEMHNAGLKAALDQSARLADYPPIVVARVVFKTTRFVKSRSGQRLLDAALKALSDNGPRALRQLNREQRIEQFETINDHLKDAIRQLALESGMEQHLRSKLIDEIKSLQLYLHGIARS